MQEVNNQAGDVIFGVSGVLATDGERVQCHLCGKWFQALNQHLMKKHRMDCDDYRARFGLNWGASLFSPALQAKHRAGQTAHLSQFWAADNAQHLAGLTEHRPLAQQWRNNVKAAHSTPEFKAHARELRNDPAHPLNSPEAKAKRLATGRTPKYRAECRQRVLDGVSPIQRPDVREKARATTQTPESKARKSAALKGLKKPASFGPLKSKLMKGSFQKNPPARDGRGRLIAGTRSAKQAA